MSRHLARLALLSICALSLALVPSSVCGSTKQFGYVRSMAKKAGRWYVTVTYVQYLTGAAAVQAAKEDGVIQSDAEAELVENMYLRPQGSRVDVLPVATHVSVFLLVADAQGSLPTDSDGKVKHTRVPIERFAVLSTQN